MENKIYELLLETQAEMKEIKTEIKEIKTTTKEIKAGILELMSEILELKSEMKQEFKMLHKRLDRFENKMLQEFREMARFLSEK